VKVHKLSRHGIPDSIIQRWEKTQGKELLPLQSQAIVNHGLLEGKSLIICAPTSSGKTFCGEMAAVVNLFKGKKAIFMVPLKAIAEEMYSDFVEKYAPLGIKVAVSTRDRQEFDRDIERGNFDLAVMIYEKFNQLLIKNLDILKVVNLLVVDELQMIADSTRGPVLELALIKIKNSGFMPQILGLSSVLNNADQLASWLGCHLLLEKSRPVELLRGVLLDGEFRFKKHNTSEEGSEQLAHSDSGENQDILFANIQQLLQQGEQVLVFLKSKKTCENCALIFTEQSRIPPAQETIRALSQLENTSLKEMLIPCLQSGIAFHNADLTFDERKAVENGYLKGEIRAIFSTTTLSLGVNLPAKTVFIETQKFQLGDHSGKTVMLPVTWSEYENMSGRAGRFGLQPDFGRSVVIAQNSFQFDYLWEEYIEGREENVDSQLFKKEQDDVILDLAASGLAKTLSQFKQATDSSLGGRFIPHLEETLEKKLNQLVDLDILFKKDECYHPTRLGSLLAFKGISLGTGLSIKKRLERSSDFDPFGWIYSVLDTKDGEEVYISVSFWEQQSRIHESHLKERYANVTPPEEIRKLLDRKISFSPGEIRLVKLSSLLCEWTGSTSTFDLEKKFLCRSGQIEQIAGRTSWLLDAACGLAKIMITDRKLVHFLRRLSLQVNFGVDESGIQLARLRVPGLGRDYIWRLVKSGFSNPKKIRETKIEKLEQIIPRPVAERLKEKTKPAQRKLSVGALPANRHRNSPGEQASLVIDGTPVKDKLLIVVNGERLALPAKSFKFLVKLAWAGFANEGGWIHKNDFEPGENQTRYLHRMKKQITPFLNPDQNLLENNRLGCYRLCIPQTQTKINLDALAKNPDAEIVEIARKLSNSET
jgi:helicase